MKGSGATESSLVASSIDLGLVDQPNVLNSRKKFSMRLTDEICNPIYSLPLSDENLLRTMKMSSMIQTALGSRDHGIRKIGTRIKDAMMTCLSTWILPANAQSPQRPLSQAEFNALVPTNPLDDF